MARDLQEAAKRVKRRSTNLSVSSAPRRAMKFSVSPADLEDAPLYVCVNGEYVQTPWWTVGNVASELVELSTLRPKPRPPIGTKVAFVFRGVRLRGVVTSHQWCPADACEVTVSAGRKDARGGYVMSTNDLTIL